MKKIIILAAAALILGGGFIGYHYWQEAEEGKLLSSNPHTKNAYELIKKREAELKKDSGNYEALMSLAFNWKSVGESLKSEKYLWRSVKSYDRVIKRWGLKAYLPFLNQANVYILLNEYKRAENNLKISIEIDPGEQNLYIALAELYRNYMNKDAASVKAVYEQGVKRVVGGGNLVVSYAGYLRDSGDYKEALKYYRMLKQAYPANTAYDEMIGELEAKIQ